MKQRIMGNNPNGNRTQTNYIVIHHAAYKYPRGRAIERIYNYHSLIWPAYDAIAYHIVVQEESGGDWQVYQTLPFNQIGAGVYGRNHESVHICLADDFTAQWPSEQQLYALATAIREMQDRYPFARVVGHRDIDLPGWRTACPANIKSVWADLMAMVSEQIDYQSLWGEKYPYIERWGIPTYWRENTELGECISHEIYTSEYVIQHFMNGLIMYEIRTGRANHAFYKGVFLL